MILRQMSQNSLAETEITLRQAAEHHGYSIINAIPLPTGKSERPCRPGVELRVFELCDPALFEQLTAQNPEVAAVLPLRVCAHQTTEGVQLSVVPPAGLASFWNDPGLTAALQQMEAVVLDILEAASRPRASRAAAARAANYEGAMELQVSSQGQIAQRIDSKGTKIEELAGTGQHDSAGG